MASPRASTFRFTVDPSAIIDAANALDAAVGATPEAIRKILNDKTQKFMIDSRRGMLRQIALTEGYVSSKMHFEPAKANDGNMVASITTAGSLVVLGHYSPEVVYRPAVRPKRAKGDPKRGVPAGMTASGVRVTVKPSAPKQIGGFTMTLKRGTDQGDTVGVFTREGKRLKHHYGIAPYSLFRYQVEENKGAFLDELAVSAITAIVDRYGREIAP